jgi:microcystin-dependent protein
MQSSARRGIQHPSLDRSDKPDIPAHFKNLVDALEVDVSGTQGTFAARPANPGYSRYIYWATDNNLMYYWDGSSWHTVGTADVVAQTLIDAKGDLIVGLTDNLAGRLPIGANDFELVADNTAPQGMKWARNPAIDLVAAKGDMLVGTGADTLTRIAVGANDQTIVADSAQPTGIKWGAPPIPAGALMMYGASGAPSGWLICDGSSLPRVDYPGLFAAIGTTYGFVDGVHFNLPDMRGRMPIGLAPSGGHAEVTTIGGNEGVAAANRRPRHNHSMTQTTLPNHAHWCRSETGTGTDFELSDGTGGGGGTPTATTTDEPTSFPAINGMAGPAGTNAIDTPPYMVINFIIKT